MTSQQPEDPQEKTINGILIGFFIIVAIIVIIGLMVLAGVFR